MSNSTKKRGVAGLLTALLALSGCGTLKTKGNKEWGSSYSGTKCAVETARWVRRDAWALTPFALPDILFSAVADTFVSPFDLAASTHPAHVNCDTGEAAKAACEFKVDPSSASVLASVDESRGRSVDFVVAGVDGVARTFARFPGCEDALTYAAPGERTLSVQVMFFNRGWRSLLSFRAGPFFAAVPLKAAVEPGKTYLVSGEIRDKDCFVWLEDAATGAKVSAEAGAPFTENQAGMLPPSVFGELAKAIRK